MREYLADILIVGGGTGGCAAALSASSMGFKVIMTEETDWIGGQLTSQAVPPDEHGSIETHGSTARYREFRRRVRQYYKDNYPLNSSAAAEPFLNPGKGNVSRICFEPRIGVSVLESMMSCPLSSGRLNIMLNTKAIAADVGSDRIEGVSFKDLLSGEKCHVKASYILDATELGDLLPMSGTEYVSGAESIKETGEPHAVSGPAEPENVQSFTWCIAVGYDRSGSSHVIDRPGSYSFWRDFVPAMNPPWSGRLLDWTYAHPWTHKNQMSGIFTGNLPALPETSYNLWNYRRILGAEHFNVPMDEITLVNWPQNDYFGGNIIDKSEDEVQKHLKASQELSLSLLYWMQTEAPRPDGGTGYPGLYPRPDSTGNRLGLAKSPYIRESRRIKAKFTVTELHVGKVALGDKAPSLFEDSVGVGTYNLDLHPSASGRNYIHLSAINFQIPLRSLVPVRMKNLIPACKNIGTTHITNGCYRLHPVEWNIGEAAGLMAAFCLNKKSSPHELAENSEKLRDFQSLLRKQNLELEWPKN